MCIPMTKAPISVVLVDIKSTYSQSMSNFTDGAYISSVVLNVRDENAYNL